MYVYVSWASLQLAESALNRKSEAATELSPESQSSQLNVDFPELLAYQSALANVTELPPDSKRTYCDKYNHDLLAARFIYPDTTGQPKERTFAKHRRMPHELDSLPLSVACRRFLLTAFPDGFSLLASRDLSPVFVGYGVRDFLSKLLLACAVLGKPMPSSILDPSRVVDLADFVPSPVEFLQECRLNAKDVAEAELYQRVIDRWQGCGVSADHGMDVTVIVANKCGFYDAFTASA